MACSSRSTRARRLVPPFLLAVVACAGCTSLAGLMGGNDPSPSSPDGSSAEDGATTGDAASDTTTPSEAATDGGAEASALVQLACGQYHCCLKKADGKVACWGANGSGQLGDGTKTDSPLPREVVNLTDAVSVAAGLSHTCAVRSVTGNNLVCWGSGSTGELGSGGGQSSVPVVAIVSEVTHVAAGPSVTCAAHADGTGHCWGYNFHSNIGSVGAGVASTPTLVPGLSDVSSFGIGNTTCALQKSGAVSCWGFNANGSVGNGATLPGPDVTGPTSVLGVTDATHLASGFYHSCVRRSGGAVACWGMGLFGQLGVGADASDRSTPVNPSLGGVIAISAGGYNSCALRANGTVACWGHGNEGEIGNGSNQNALVPNDVLGLSDAVQVSVGGFFACAVRKGGGVVCWGGGAFGDLGNGGDAGALTPKPVVGL